MSTQKNEASIWSIMSGVIEDVSVLRGRRVKGSVQDEDVALTTLEFSKH